MNNNSYEKLVSDMLHSDLPRGHNGFTKEQGFRTDRKTKGMILLIKDQIKAPSYSVLVRYAIRHYLTDVPPLTYKQLIETEIRPKAKTTSNFKMRTRINMNLDDLLDVRTRQLQTYRQHLINLVLQLMINDYQKSRKTFLSENTK